MLKASLVGAFILVVGRVFGAGREVLLAQRIGPTDAIADYILASSVYLPVCGLLGGVASALMLRRTGGARSVVSILGPISLFFSTVPIIGVVCGLFSRGEVHTLFAMSLPFYVVYGVCSGALLARGRVVASMVFSVLPPVFGCAGLLLPVAFMIPGVVLGNLLGSIFMASAAYLTVYGVSGRFLDMRWSSSTVVGKEAFAIAVVSAINIGSPIVDRFFADQLGATNLVLLNLSAILFLGIVGTLGMAIGNAAVGRESIGGDRFRSSLLFPLLIITSLSIVLTARPIAEVLTLGSMYDSGDRILLTKLLECYGLATACAVLGQVMIRVWNVTASVRAMVLLAGSLFSLNVAANLLLIPVMGVLGIAAATLLVQVAQSLILGFLTARRYLSCVTVFLSLLGGIHVFG